MGENHKPNSYLTYTLFYKVRIKMIEIRRVHQPIWEADHLDHIIHQPILSIPEAYPISIPISILQIFPPSSLISILIISNPSSIRLFSLSLSLSLTPHLNLKPSDRPTKQIESNPIQSNPKLLSQPASQRSFLVDRSDQIRSPR